MNEEIKAIAKDLAMDGLLRELPHAGTHDELLVSAVMGRLPVRRRRLYFPVANSWRFFAAAASLAIIAGVWWLNRTQAGSLELRVAEVRGKVAGFRVQGAGVRGQVAGVTESPSHPATESEATSHKPLKLGDILRPSDGVEVGADGYAKLAYPDGTQIDLHGSTRLRVTLGAGADKHAKRLALDGGRLVCSAVPQRKTFEIKTPHVVARVVGTRFSLEVGGAQTGLAVTEGKVLLERDGQSIIVGPNQTAEASADGLKMMPLRTALVGTVIKKLTKQALESVGKDGIAFDGRVLWMTTFASNVLVKVDPVSGAVAGRLEVNSGATPLYKLNGLAWDGTHLWVSAFADATPMSKNRICAVDPATGRVMKTLDVPSGFTASGVAAGDGYLWCMALARDRPYASRVFKLDPSSGAVAASWPVPPEAGGKCGLEYMAGAVWVVNWNKVWKLNAGDGTVIGVLDAPEPIYDLALSGIAGQMWMLGRMSWSVYLVGCGRSPH